MFPRIQRVRTTNEILRIFRQGSRLRSEHMTLFCLPTPATQVFKVTVIVDKKVSKKAVVRNHLKRQLREVIKQSKLPAQSYILRVYPGAEKLSDTDMRVEASKLMKRVNA